MNDLILHDVADQTLINAISLSGGEGLNFRPWHGQGPESHGPVARLHDAAALLIDESVCSPQLVLTTISQKRIDVPVLVLSGPPRPDSARTSAKVVTTEGELHYVSGDDPAGIAAMLQNRIAQRRRRAQVNQVLRDEFNALTNRPKPTPVARPAIDRFLELAPVGILFLDDTGQVAYANPYALNALGTDGTYSAGQNIRDLIPGAEGERLANAQETGTTPDARPLEIRIDAEPDLVRYLSVRVISVTEYGDWASRMIILTDETAKVEALFHMEALAKARSEFLATASHELRTPLNAIIGFSDLMQANAFGPLNNRYQGYSSDIHMSARHILDLVNHTLDIARAESGKLELTFSTISVSDLLNECLTFIEPQSMQKKIKVAVDVPQGVGSISSDKLHLRQVIVNLLSNAVKFTPEHGTVTVSARSISPDRVRIAISDTGIGISKNDIPKVLEAFGQVRQRTDVKAEGTGLGLPLARKLTQRLGGTFDLTSEVGKGTVVAIILPKSRPDDPNDPTDQGDLGFRHE